MSSTALSDQLTAMAFIDKLRHEQKQIQDHLDLPRRRADIAERIRAYYIGNAIEFDDNLIEKGVRQFFAHRLKLETPALNGFDTWLVKWLSRRGASPASDKPGTIRLSPLILLILLFSALILWATHHNKDAGRVDYLVKNAWPIRDKSFTLNEQVQSITKRLAALGKSNAEHPNANVGRLLQRAQSRMPTSAFRTDLGVDLKITKDNLDSVELQVMTLKAQQLRFETDSNQIYNDMKYAGAIIWMRQSLRDISEDPKSTARIEQSGSLKQQMTLLGQQLDRIDNETTHDDAFSTFRDIDDELFGIGQ
ncbi:hypothetical protein PHLH6_35030 [Pseudomonas sp. Seg1]|uniref:DUF6384 family protein n=1 Tax=Pseudomonas sp. Seg1 TaxID=2678259 RepID=UPI001BB36B58|nr:DUF6384 family protein [Pseudomonas sp. Seg1]BBP71499.1 hypothetical protein PHLH6_35030 [Pseudomonas sp. Seg1]